MSNIPYKNMALGRFNTAAALQTAATHCEMKHAEPFTTLAMLLRIEAEAIARLGFQETSIAFEVET